MPAKKGYREGMASVKSKLYKSFDTKHEQLKYMSPFDKNGIPPVLNSLGHFLTVDNMVRGDVATHTTNPLGLLFIPSTRGVLQSVLFNLSTGVHITGSGDKFSPLQKYQHGDAPTVSRTLRAGLKINCTSSSNVREGVVRVLQISSPFEFEWVNSTSCDISTTFASELLSMARTHPRAKSYTAEDLSKGENELVVGPATLSSYHSYGNKEFITANDCASNQTTFGDAQKDMSMNNVLIVFEPTANAVINYELTLMMQTGFRYPANTLLSTLQKPAKVDESGRIQKTHATATASGGELHDLTRASSVRTYAPASSSQPSRGRKRDPATGRFARKSQSRSPITGTGYV